MADAILEGLKSFDVPTYLALALGAFFSIGGIWFFNWLNAESKSRF